MPFSRERLRLIDLLIIGESGVDGALLIKQTHKVLRGILAHSFVIACFVLSS